LYGFRLQQTVPNFLSDWEAIILTPIERSSEELPSAFLLCVHAAHIMFNEPPSNNSLKAPFPPDHFWYFSVFLM